MPRHPGGPIAGALSLAHNRLRQARVNKLKLPPFKFASPTTLAEAIALLAAGAGIAKAITGGQSLLPVLAFRLAAPTLLVAVEPPADLHASATYRGSLVGTLLERVLLHASQ